MKKILSVVLVCFILCSVFSLSAFAVSGNEPCGDALDWTVSGAGVLQITGTGEMYDFYEEAPWSDYSDTVTSAVISDGVTSVGDCAFEGFENLKKVTLSSTVTSVGSRAFSGCTALSSLSGGVLEKVGADAFSDTVLSKDIGNYFEGMLYINKILVSADGNIKDAVIMAGTTCIADSAFEDISSLETVTFPASLLGIGNYSFKNCSSLTLSVLPESLSFIGDEAFFGCLAVDDVVLPSSVKYIGTKAFDNTAFVKDLSKYENKLLYSGSCLIKADASADGTVKIKTKTKIIAGSAFEDCSAVAGVTLPSTLNVIGPSAFADCIYLASAKIPASVSLIGDEAFYNCKHLSNVVINDGVKEIGSEVFCGCLALSSLKVPSSVVKIGYAPFEGCADNFVVLGDKGSYIAVYAENYDVPFSLDVPAGVTSLTVTNTATGIKIKWSAVAGADEYVLYRKTSASASWSLYKHIDKKSLTYTDTSVKNGVNYIYTVRAANKNGKGAYIKKGAALICLLAPELSAPKNTTAGVKVQWSPVKGAAGYYVYRKLGNAASWSRIATVKDPAKLYVTDKKVSSGKTYKYTVRAFKGSVSGGYDNTGVTVKYLSAGNVKSAVSQKKGNAVSWSVVTGANGYNVYRKTGSGSWSRIAVVKGNSSISYRDSSAVKGKTYTYCVRPYYSSFLGAYNTTKSVYTKY